MERDRNKMADRIIHLTLHILFRLTGEDYTVVKKSSSGHCQAPVCEEWGRTLIHEEMEKQKVLELINKMMELLTGEEWEYVEGHKDQYKDVMMEDPQPLTSPVRSSKRSTPERCPCPLLPQDDQGENLININAPETDVSSDEKYKEDIPTGKDLIYIKPTDIKEEETYVIGDEQYKEDIPTGKDLIYINATGIKEEEEKDVSGDEQYKEDIPTGNRPDYCTRSSEGHLISSEIKAEDYIPQDTYEENSIIPDTPSAIHSKDLSSNPFIQVLSSDSSQTIKQNESRRRDVEHQRDCAREMQYFCSECGKCFTKKSYLVQHQRTHTGEKPFSCAECGKYFTTKSNLIQHQKIHTGERPFLCSECGKCFTEKSHLVKHQKTHTGERPFQCSECGKCYTEKSFLVRHQRTHTGEKPFSCAVCGKYFTEKSFLAKHQKTHTGEKPFACSECGKCFTRKSTLVNHHRIHTGEKPFSCAECGRCFTEKSTLLQHQRTHR